MAIDKLTDTLVSGVRKPGMASSRDACLVMIYPTGPGMGIRYQLTTSRVVIGRAPICEIQVEDASVSRQHALIERDGQFKYFANDLQSTNGTFVNDVPANRTEMKDGDYLRVGNCIYRFLAGGNIEADYHEVIYNLTIMDALTGCPNKRFFKDFLEREISRSNRYLRPLSLIMMDIDHFKQLNDTLGHLAGDQALREIANLVKQNIRKEELFARFGGEEFAVVLPETNLEQAVQVAERIRTMVGTHTFQLEGKPYPITLSMGVSHTQGEPALTAEQLIQIADANLYDAKNQGRNRVVAKLLEVK